MPTENIFKERTSTREIHVRDQNKVFVDTVVKLYYQFDLKIEDKDGGFSKHPFMLDTGTHITTIPRKFLKNVKHDFKGERYVTLKSATGERFRVRLFSVRFMVPGLDLVFERDFGLIQDDRPLLVRVTEWIRDAVRRDKSQPKGLLGLSDLLNDFDIHCCRAGITFKLKATHGGEPLSE